MALPEEFLQYPMRRHAMDHDLYKWQNHFERTPFVLPNNAKLAIMITMPLEYFPLNTTGKPFKAPGSMVTNYPDFRHYTTRDYGNRVGVYRILEILEQFNVKANVAVNAVIAEKYPYLIKQIEDAQHEILAHGYDMDALHYGNMDLQQEEEQMDNSLEILKKNTNSKIIGWMSPAFSESFNTLELLAKKGIQYVCDWANDELPYTIKTKQGNIVAMPITQELSDRQIIINYHHTEDSFVQQVKDQFDCLYTEAEKYGGRILSLQITPYITGLPYRIKMLEEILSYVKGKDNVISVTACELL